MEALLYFKTLNNLNILQAPLLKACINFLKTNQDCVCIFFKLSASLEEKIVYNIIQKPFKYLALLKKI